MKFALILTALVGLTSASTSAEQMKVDPRAVAACQIAGATFVQISECLPDAHVAVLVLDEFDRVYPAEAAPLKVKCVEKNAQIAAASTCILSAIEAAISLAKQLPEGSKLNDPVFDAVRSEDNYQALEKVQKQARAGFPEQSFWGGQSYFPYQ